ncbi:uncharacterized protein si:ch73-70k4.1 [Hippoglossus hippoglossus]|uniref:uncharacterized protein si:ch73-70k4.1 n=1 Tax=Hippoglossus hippoglossus TaxID=8267 RepID=UPI00148D1ED1|nr:uncharacterized protein si:ch73-70k4.1 [Hippoglossus hippoglossus]
MDENQTKSKLKRRKSSVEKPQVESCSRDRERSMDITEESCGSVDPAAAWWSREELPAVESLWAITLKSALPYLQDQHWHLVPDLPNPSAARPAAQQLGEQWWCDVREEVAPLPEPAPPSPRTLSSPDPLGRCSPQKDVSVHTKPAAHTSDTQFFSHSIGRTAPQALGKRQWSSLHSREEAASSAGCSSVRGEEGGGGGEQDEAVGLVKRQLLTNQVKERVNEEEVVMDKEEEEELGTVRGDGGAAGGGGGGGERLQSCPMCLIVFHVGFTQMDCDSHLAQCLSEMNVDMTW